ncbi:PilZ domain-containing protein [Flocculibacter collagenilyticus]|uniref:PilZ domain-containing protein n=1 Tax=Flocculibacter collagenilyticus TaxID=2744479 RepID=UPI0018F57A03|nr:PilZ domain-containing protein [Flocculibacter collagenilyticus]
MTETIEEKIEQLHEYFMIEHVTNVNIIPLAMHEAMPHYDDFIVEMPDPFKLATEISTLETSALRPLRHLGDHAEELAEFLRAQSRKIDLIMSHILTMQDEPEHRHATLAYGGGGLRFTSELNLQLGQKLLLKLFLSQEAAAIYCYGEIVKIEDNAYSAVFSLIREEDREIVVKASLHEQSKQLKRKSELKKQNI